MTPTPILETPRLVQVGLVDEGDVDSELGPMAVYVLAV